MTTTAELPALALTDTEFRQVCAGPTSSGTLAKLAEGQYSERLALLVELCEQATTKPVYSQLVADIENAWHILELAHRHDADAVRDVLTYPTVGIWLARMVRAVLAAEAIEPEIGYLYSLAAAAAIRADIPCDVTVVARDGVIVLPTVGRIRLPAGHRSVDLKTSATVVQLATEHGLAESIDIACDSGMFRRTIRHPMTAVLIDDVDPYREFTEPLPPRELTEREVAEWHALLDEAWRILGTQYPEYASELAVGLRTIVPLPDGSGKAGASSWGAFGAIALPAKGTGVQLAEALIHEFQHSKLNAVLDIETLVEPDQTAPGWYAPWRDDPRPLSGVLHGIYAFVSVVEFLQRQYPVLDGVRQRQALFLFAHRRQQVRQVVDHLKTTGGLTDRGRELVDIVSDRLAAGEGVPVPPEVLDVVGRLAVDHRTVWRLRHVTPNPHLVARLVAAWRAGEPAGDLGTTGHVCASDDLHGKDVRTELLQATIMRLPANQNAPAADVAYCAGRIDEAAAGYLTRIEADPKDWYAWSGLGLCLLANNGPTALRTAPELVAAVHNGLGDADPVGVAAWLTR